MSASVTIVFIMAITITADFQPAFKDWLKETFTHHWVGKGILAVVIFILAAHFTRPSSDDEALLARALNGTVRTAVFCSVVLFGLYVYEAFFR